MKEQLEKRLEELRKEYETGQQMLVETEARMEHLKNSLLRISGAIQVTEELLQENNQQNGEASTEGVASGKAEGKQ